MNTIRNYIYIDEPLIESIYSQLHDETVTDLKITQSKSKSKSFGFNVGLFKHIGIISADTSINGESSKNYQIEKNVSYSNEQKIEQIIKAISKSKNYYDNLTKATSPKSQKNADQTLFINIYETFFSRYQFKTVEDIKNIQNCGYLEFERGDIPISPDSKIAYKMPFDNYNHRDDYYKDCRYRVVMSMNINKMKTSWRGLTSHLPVAIRGGAGKIKLGVFGQLRAIDDLFFQIKPFAVWW